ncbi:MAG TPA: histidine kinase [Pyrinomonadaceae bacterium]|nr:histidine kinase [Pyrinomonadaceae bacterium]
MKKGVVPLLHLGYWITHLSLIVMVFAVATIQRGRPASLSNVMALSPLILLWLLPGLLSFYSSYYLLFPGFLFRRKILALTVFASVSCLISALFGCLASIALFGFDQPIFNDAREFFNLVLLLFSISAIHCILALLIRGFINWYDGMKLKEELMRKSHEMELALVRSQLSPHFLFNTINNIDVLIKKDAMKASEYLNKLSGILRYLLYEVKAEKISLDDELKFVEKYLDLQKIRTANRNYVSYKVTGEAHDTRIAPMLFLPFIENAFKHTESNKKINSINIEIVIQKRGLKFKCRNTYQNGSHSGQESGGLGNELIAKRLMLLYPDKHALELTKTDGIYGVELSLDLYGH